MSTVPMVGVGKEGDTKMGPSCFPEEAAPVQHPLLELPWPCAGTSLAVNAIDTQLHDPINSGLTLYDGGWKYGWTPLSITIAESGRKERGP